ncbi:MAG: Gfo/Idh/MocA family oxidoreductase [Planctomycetota bacterium]|nr:Gfo/Idh/MocA family oxidoreductase [Planctomycetota bacterium]
MTTKIDRRDFIQHSAGIAGLGAAALAAPAFGRVPVNSRVNVLCVGVVGTIGSVDRKQVDMHPAAEIVGLCDVDSQAIDKAATRHPDAFTCKDYREAFDRHGDKFDAVIVSTPDHTHAPIMLTALANGKHCYGQKPLVHQLEELSMIDRAMDARPDLVTQVGNQRMAYPGRRAAVEILRSGALGPAIAAYAWTGSPNRGAYFNYDRKLHAPSTCPDHIDYDLWLGPCADVPYRDEMLPIKWRSWWDYGTGGLGDWGVHVLDVILFGYDELQSPMAVKTHAPRPSDEFHTYPCISTVTYAVDSDRFSNRHFPLHYSDCGQTVSRASLGLPAGDWKDSNMTVVECEGGVLALTAGGDLEIWRDGEMTPGLEMPGLPDFPEINHWHAWVDNIVGRKTELRTPFKEGVRITEPALLAVKAARFPNTELVWDRSANAFTNHDEATATIVRRDYRDGFAPPSVG